jgi:hypothetical protein
MEKNKETTKEQEVIEQNSEQTAPQDPMQEIVELRKQINELQKNNESLSDLLLQVADKKQLAIYYQKHQQKIPPVVKLRVIDGKVIIGWRTLKDEVYQDPVSMRWYEKQIIEVVFEDGTTKQYALMDYVRLYQHIEAKVVSTLTNSEDGKISFKVQTDDGREYVIGAEFIN